MTETIIIAHRGESFDAPENTLSAIKLAWERNVQAVEIDIQQTKDSEIVVIHDKDTLRISGKKKTIKKSSLKELKLLNAGFYKEGNWDDERIPSLSEVLATVPENGKLIIEIKSDNNILQKLKYELSQSNLNTTQIELIAFDANTLAKAKQLMPEYRMLWLLSLDYRLPWWLALNNNRKLINKLNKLKLDGVDVWAGKLLTKSFISEIKKSGLCIYTWTVNDLEKAKSLIENGIDGITTDRAGWMMEQLKIS
ncbi:MAG: glycerophosphodiester phosphodiesterase [Bacteroidetes bacterium]|nr:glycerophosphodiester phosphodiesterase [Bacteroidota bacterium]MBL6943310.1 glycerophosphodiester phosphodiesterase [Bacteroidales bacterium]